MNKNIFSGKISLYGFLYSEKCIFSIVDCKKIIIIITCNNNKSDVYYYGYIIEIINITGLNYDFNIGDDMRVIIETKGTDIYFEYNIKGVNVYTSSRYYYYLSGKHYYMIKYFKNPGSSILINEHLVRYSNSGLPYWCVWINIFNKKIRIIIQYINIYIEFCVFVWSLYQIVNTFPDYIVNIVNIIND